MQITIKTEEQTVTVDAPEGMDIHEMLDLWSRLMVVIGYHQESIKDAICQKFSEINN